MRHFSKILIRPIVTEKMTALQETENKYAFEIPSDINKIDDLVLPIANVVFIGHGQEEILENYRIYNAMRRLTLGTHYQPI